MIENVVFSAQIVEKNKNIIKFDEAKQLGTMVNAARNQMNAIKAQLEQSQIGRAMDQMDRTRTDSDRAEDNGTDGEEEQNEKALYRTHYLSLKNIRGFALSPFSVSMWKERRIQVDCGWLANVQWRSITLNEGFAQKEPKADPARL